MLKKILIGLTLILLLVNFYTVSEYTAYDRRLVNLISLSCYFLIFIVTGGTKKILLLYSMLAFVGTDYLLLYYETNDVIAKVIPVLKISVYFMLTVSVFDKVRLLNHKLSITVAFVSIIVLNLVWMFNLIWDKSEKFNDSFEFALHFLYGLIMVWMCTIAINCYLRFKTNRSLFFLIFILGLVLSDAAWFIAYYYNFNFFFYVYTIFYLVGLAYLIRYAETENKEDDAFMAVL
ncbi:hypothetical protein [Winogradskyella ursingii]|uniref:hypothetical protein n=1 Tax=Winogradskyella ursingii TaxID=2686079 RepID=UPI0015CA692D|nr:hypothetical protein [Winogradskyella ursingii]